MTTHAKHSKVSRPTIDPGSTSTHASQAAYTGLDSIEGRAAELPTPDDGGSAAKGSEMPVLACDHKRQESNSKLGSASYVC